ncbi:hypothetical protein [Amycolatopsis sp. YIM 10]|uniref:hypothetical protein n=1 Tax=Amycolatopsis sp. YIM 10 TaxID=2653857 RepID=UPI0012906DE3|nr:hypothetical protein [Amycolatopsis sp. YIM 10]QFU90952.1 hypothetical protein YIM_28900 [Amycolatopsis sp. YIM 10]
MSEDLVAAAQREEGRTFGEYEQVGLGTLAAYEAWQAEGLSPREIAARMTRASRVGSETVGWYQLLTQAGVPVTEAGRVAAETAAARTVRVQVGAPEQAEAVCDRFDALVEQVAAGRDAGSAIADFRESLVGWRGDGPEGPFGRAALVTFDDGTVMPDGVELAGLRETGARHSIVAAQVDAGIDTYLAARDEGADQQAALNQVTGVPGVRDVVARFARSVEDREADPVRARHYAVADVVAEAALGQFVSLRNQGVDVDTAVATAAGGNPVALHAISGLVQRTRDGLPEEVADADASAAAATAAVEGENYVGPDGLYDGLLRFDDVDEATRTAMAEEAERNLGWLTRHGMDPGTANRLSAVDSASRVARTLRHNETQVLRAIQDAIDGVDAPWRHLADDDNAPADRVDDNQLQLGEQVAECGQAVDAAEQAVQRGENTEDEAARSEQISECGQAVSDAEHAVCEAEAAREDNDRAERVARWNAEDEAAEHTDDTAEGWEQQ